MLRTPPKPRRSTEKGRGKKHRHSCCAVPARQRQRRKRKNPAGRTKKERSSQLTWGGLVAQFPSPQFLLSDAVNARFPHGFQTNFFTALQILMPFLGFSKRHKNGSRAVSYLRFLKGLCAVPPYSESRKFFLDVFLPSKNKRLPHGLQKRIFGHLKFLVVSGMPRKGKKKGNCAVSNLIFFLSYCAVSPFSESRVNSTFCFT